MSSLTLLAVLPSVAFAGRADAILELLQQDKADQAQLRCDRLNADLSTSEPTLRNACARAYFEKAAAEDTVSAWIRFQQTWRGTTLIGKAREREAAAALRDIGEHGEEHQYTTFLAAYGDTAAGIAAKSLMAAAAFEHVDTPAEAVDVAARYPDNPQLPDLVERFPDAFLKVDVDGEEIQVTLDPPLNIPGAAKPYGRWAVRWPDGRVVDWRQVAEQHLSDIRAEPALVKAVRRSQGEVIEPCQIPGAPWQLVVAVTLGPSESFFPHPGSGGCSSLWPTLGVYRGGQLAALGISPSIVLRFPTNADLANGWFPWGDPKHDTRIWLAGAPGQGMLVGLVIGQPAGRLFMLHQAAGGMPFYVAQGPPATALPLSNTLTTVGLPEGWSLTTSSGPIAPGGTSADPIRVVAALLGTDEWVLPPGEVRAWPPVVQLATGLHRNNPKLLRDQGPVLPRLDGLVGPDGSQPVEFRPLEDSDVGRISGELMAMGVPVQLRRVWTGFMKAGPAQLVYDGVVGGKEVRGLLDPFKGGGGYRAYVFLNDGNPKSDEVFGFSYQGNTYVVWKREDGYEALHFEPSGLMRELNRTK